MIDPHLLGLGVNSLHLTSKKNIWSADVAERYIWFLIHDDDNKKAKKPCEV